jgi:hypothetical protein
MGLQPSLMDGDGDGAPEIAPAHPTDGGAMRPLEPREAMRQAAHSASRRGRALARSRASTRVSNSPTSSSLRAACASTPSVRDR